MSKTTSARTPASTFLTHSFGRGLVDQCERYVVERFRALANGEKHRWSVSAGQQGSANTFRGLEK